MVSFASSISARGTSAADIGPRLHLIPLASLTNMLTMTSAAVSLKPLGSLLTNFARSSNHSSTVSLELWSAGGGVLASDVCGAGGALVGRCKRVTKSYGNSLNQHIKWGSNPIQTGASKVF